MKKGSKSAYHHGDLKRELMNQALPLIDERGLDGFKIRELARRVGVTHAATYKHFVDRRALLVALAQEGFDSFTEALRQAVDPSAALEDRIGSVARTYFVWSQKNSAAYQVMFGPRLNEDDRYPQLEDAIEVAFSTVDTMFLASGCDARQAREYAIAFMTQLHGYAEMVRLKRIRVRSRAVAEDFLARLVRPFALGVTHAST